MLLIFKIFLAAVVVLTLFVVLSQLLEFLFVCFFSPPSFLMLLEENWTGWGFVGCCWRDG